MRRRTERLEEELSEAEITAFFPRSVREKHPTGFQLRQTVDARQLVLFDLAQSAPARKMRGKPVGATAPERVRRLALPQPLVVLAWNRRVVTAFSGSTLDAVSFEGDRALRGCGLL